MATPNVLVKGTDGTGGQVGQPGGIGQGGANATAGVCGGKNDGECKTDPAKGGNGLQGGLGKDGKAGSNGSISAAMTFIVADISGAFLVQVVGGNGGVGGAGGAGGQGGPGGASITTAACCKAAYGETMAAGQTGPGGQGGNGGQGGDGAAPGTVITILYTTISPGTTWTLDSSQFGAGGKGGLGGAAGLPNGGNPGNTAANGKTTPAAQGPILVVQANSSGA